MSSTKTYSNFSKAISVALLVSSPCAIAETQAKKIFRTDTFSNVSVSGQFADKQVQINTLPQYYFVIERTDSAMPDAFPIPRTEIGRKLLAYRRAALASGMKMLSIDEIDAMVKEGRGASA